MGTFRMPSLGADMEAGTLVEWLKRPGDAVTRGETIAVVETQKGAIEVEVFESGTVDELLVAEGTRVPVGTPLATIRGTGAPAEAEPEAGTEMPAAADKTPAPASAEAAPTAPRPEPAPSRTPSPSPATTTHRPRASPAARKLAAERGVALAGLTGSGPDGAIVAADVEAAPTTAAKTEPERPATGTRRGLDLAEMRKAIAAAMARSKREIPHYYLSQEIDLAAASAFLERANAERDPRARLLMAVLFLKATAVALTRHPQFNGTYEADTFTASTPVHLGTAVAIRGGGLIAPAIHDAEGKSLDDLMADLRDLVARVRSGQLRGSELSDPTVTVSSLGERGVDALQGVIHPPQVALVGFGTPRPRPWAVDDRVEVRPVVAASLAADHRVSDGHRGGLFLAEIDRLLQEPEAL